MAKEPQQVEPTWPPKDAQFEEPKAGEENLPQPPSKGAGWAPHPVKPNSTNP